VVFDPESEGGPAGNPDHRLAHAPEDFGSEELGLGHGVKLVDGTPNDGASIVDCKCVSGCPECAGGSAVTSLVIRRGGRGGPS
jgi:hypothetical protein